MRGWARADEVYLQLKINLFSAIIASAISRRAFLRFIGSIFGKPLQAHQHSTQFVAFGKRSDSCPGLHCLLSQLLRAGTLMPFAVAGLRLPRPLIPDQFLDQ